MAIVRLCFSPIGVITMKKTVTDVRFPALADNKDYVAAQAKADDIKGRLKQVQSKIDQESLLPLTAPPVSALADNVDALLANPQSSAPALRDAAKLAKLDEERHRLERAF